MKQTAVEWLIEQIQNNHAIGYNNITTQQIEQAKEMEKQQIKQSYTDGKYQSGYYENSEQYYNETFKTKEK
jgi:hypothetical protein